MIRGRAAYAKIINPVPTYDKTDKERTFDLIVDTETKKYLAGLGLASYVKTNKNGDDYIKFSRRVTKQNPDGKDLPRVPAAPLRIVDRAGKPWGGDLIGNDSVLNVQFAVNDKALGGKKPSLIAVQVWEHVPYEGAAGAEREEFPVDESGVESW